MKQLIKNIFICSIMLLLVFPSNLVHATENDGFDLNLNAEGTITIDYNYEGVPLEDVDFDVYRIADVNSKGEFYVLPEYSQFDIDFDLLTELEYWLPLKFNLQNYINLNMMEHEQGIITNQNGQYVLSGLKLGLYYIEPKMTTDGVTDFYADPTLIMIGQHDGEQDIFVYHFKIVPKVGGEEHDPNPTISVKKVWENTPNALLRPEEIEIDLYCDGELYDTVTLNEANGWYYEWNYMDPDCRWAIEERTQLEDFEVSYSKNHFDFTVTNTFTGEIGGEELPETGISYTEAGMFAAAGVLLLIAGIALNKYTNGKAD